MNGAPPIECRADIFVGLDDTDNDESIGTGKLARRLAGRLHELGCEVVSVTRHQHLVDPAIPYTSRNSSAALALKATDVDALEAACIGFIAEHEHPGADPGLCIATRQSLAAVADGAARYGLDTQTRVLEKRESIEAAARWSLPLHELGGSGLGIVGALGAVCLRFGGDDGRLLDYGPCRELTGTMTVGELTERLRLEGVFTADGRALEPAVAVDTCGWVRPDLQRHAPRLIVHPTADGGWSTRR